VKPKPALGYSSATGNTAYGKQSWSSVVQTNITQPTEQSTKSIESPITVAVSESSIINDIRTKIIETERIQESINKQLQQDLKTTQELVSTIATNQQEATQTMNRIQIQLSQMNKLISTFATQFDPSLATIQENSQITPTTKTAQPTVTPVPPEPGSLPNQQ